MWKELGARYSVFCKCFLESLFSVWEWKSSDVCLTVPIYMYCNQTKYGRRMKEVNLGFWHVWQTRVELVELPEALDRAEAYGRIAFSIQDSEVKQLKKVQFFQGKVTYNKFFAFYSCVVLCCVVIC